MHLCSVLISSVFVLIASKEVVCNNHRCFKPYDCSGIKKRYPDSKSGVYQIYPDYTGIGVHVYCDMDRSCGGWTVIQRRMDGTVNFYRDWIDYKYGFGKPDKEHWLGNNVIHQLTRHGNHELLIVMEDFDETVRYAHYGTFFIGNENEKYKLNVTKYSGNAGDSLVGHNGYPFTTKDQDNDKLKSNCATEYKGFRSTSLPIAMATRQIFMCYFEDSGVTYL